MTREEKQKAIDALKLSAPVIVVTPEEFNDYIQTLNKVMDWLEQEPCVDWRKISVYKVETDEKVAQDIKKLLELNNQPLITSVLPAEPKVEANGINEIINKIRADLHYNSEMHEDGNWYLMDKWVDEILDKYKAKDGEK